MKMRWILPACALLTASSVLAASPQHQGHANPAKIDTSVLDLLRRMDAQNGSLREQQQVLARGYEVHARVQSSVFNGAVQLQGRGADSRIEMTAGVSHLLIVRHGSKLWTRDVSGLVKETALTAQEAIPQERLVGRSLVDAATYKLHPEVVVRLAHAPQGVTPLSNTIWLEIRDRSLSKPVVAGVDAQTARIRCLVFGGGLRPFIVSMDGWRPTALGIMPAHVRLTMQGSELADISLDQAGVRPVASSAFAPLQNERVQVARPVEIPLATDQGLRYVVPVSIDGHVYRFGIDSMASRTIIDDRAAPAMHLTNIAQLTPQVNVATLNGFALGDARFGEERVIVRHLATPDNATPLDGILGFPFFAQSALIIDPQRSVLTLGAPGSLALDGAKTALSTVGDAMTASATFAGDDAVQHVFLQTASLDTVQLATSFAREHPAVLEQPLPPASSAAPVTNAIARGVRIGMLPERKDMLVQVAPMFGVRRHPAHQAAVAGAVGLGFLRDYRVGLDVQKSEIVLAPLDGVPQATSKTPDAPAVITK